MDTEKKIIMNKHIYIYNCVKLKKIHITSKYLEPARGQCRGYPQYHVEPHSDTPLCHWTAAQIIGCQRLLGFWGNPTDELCPGTSL